MRPPPYISITHTERLTESRHRVLSGSVGYAYDNALADTIKGLYKDVMIHWRRPRRLFEAVNNATLQWVNWFNTRRLLEPIGNIPPAEAE